MKKRGRQQPKEQHGHSCARRARLLHPRQQQKKASSAASPAPITAPRQHRKPRVCRLPRNSCCQDCLFFARQLYTARLTVLKLGSDRVDDDGDYDDYGG